ncbi:MAG: response regulator [Deltaproteobacteria bacterium]|nr:response regulator [Deltaproteobacteria bacterium]
MSERPKILIVDDEPDMLDFLERSLRKRFEVVRAQGAPEALELLEQAEFAVLITDQKMPRMGGLELLERISDRYPKLVRLLLSGFAEIPEIKKARARCRIHNYIFKPVDSRKLLEAVDQAQANAAES